MFLICAQPQSVSFPFCRVTIRNCGTLTSDVFLEIVECVVERRLVFDDTHLSERHACELGEFAQIALWHLSKLSLDFPTNSGRSAKSVDCS